MTRAQILRRRLCWLTWFFMIGLFLSGATAIPLLPEVNWLAEISATAGPFPVLHEWLLRVRDALAQTQVEHPFLFYGTDWLAFGHFVMLRASVLECAQPSGAFSRPPIRVRSPSQPLRRG